MTVCALALADVANGGLFTDGDWVESKDQDPNGAVRLTQLADVGVGEFRNRSDRWLREDQAAQLNCTFLQPRDLLIARMPDPIGRSCLVPEDIGRAVTAVDVAILRIRRPDVLPEYAMWAINSPSFRTGVEALQSGTTRKRISRRNLATLKIPLPSTSEQRRIVEILEDHLSRLDAGSTLLLQGEKRLGPSEQPRCRRRSLRRSVMPLPKPGLCENWGKLVPALRLHDHDESSTTEAPSHG